MFQLAFGHLPMKKRPTCLCTNIVLPSLPLIWLIICRLTVALAIGAGSILPLMVIGLPRLYGAWHTNFTGILQHAALADNVVDHRLNNRTIFKNPISRFIYWNMNYHLEYNMFTMVPYHKLPALHELSKGDLIHRTRQS